MRLSRIQATEWKKCREDPAYFIQKYIWIRHPMRGKIKFALYEWQKELVGRLHRRENVLVIKSRQVGVSWAAGAYVVYLITFRADIEASLFSIGERQAISLLGKIKYMYRSLPTWLRHKVVENNQKSLAVAVYQFNAITGETEINSTSRINSYPSSPDSGRGETPNFVLFDEHAAQQNDEEVWGAVQPSLLHGGQCVSVSTPKNYDTQYAKLYEEVFGQRLEGWFGMRVHYTDCGFDREWLSRVTVGMTPAQIRQEYEMEFFQGENPVFDASSLAAVYRPMVHEGGQIKLFRQWQMLYSVAGLNDLTHDAFDEEFARISRLIEKTERCFTGVDSSEGKRKDQNSVTTLNEYGVQVACNHNDLSLPQWSGYTGENGQDVPGFVSRWIEVYPGNVVVEENGPGLAVYNRLRVEDTGMTTVRMKRASDNQNRTGSKTRIINALVLAMAGKNIIITDPITYNQMLAYQKDENTGKMSAPKGRLDDAVMSLAWANYSLDMEGRHSLSDALPMTTGTRIFGDTDMRNAINVGAVGGDGLAGFGPKVDVNKFGIRGEWGDFDIERIRSLR